MSAIAMQKMAESVRRMLPKDFGFTILVFPYNNQSGEANHLRTLANILESEEDFETPENNIY